MKRLVLDRMVANIQYGIRELTVEEIRLWLVRMERAASSGHQARPRLLMRLLIWLGALEPLPAVAQDVVELMLFDDMAILDVLTLTTLSREQIGQLTPAHVREVWAQCKEVNSDFFRMRRRLEVIGQPITQAHGATLSAQLPA